MGVITDPNQDRRSVMMRKPCVCSGAANGVQCAHYWALDQKFAASNSDVLRRGDVRRACKMADGFLLEFTERESPTYCQQYVPRAEPGLVALVKRAAALALGLAPRAGKIGGKDPEDQARERDSITTWGYVTYDPLFEGFRPLSDAEVKKLREQMPDQPFSDPVFGKDPSTWTVDDLVRGEQVGIVKGYIKRNENGVLVQYDEDGNPTGFPDPNALSADAEAALDGMFGADGDGVLSKKQENE